MDDETTFRHFGGIIYWALASRYEEPGSITIDSK